ncbi:hypothetical protein LJB87_00310 [Alistipes sp. OttesenSCG-928-L06]|nr:hypothetical protein [Alistipes sp. OttesenSCG-928-L06]
MCNARIALVRACLFRFPGMPVPLIRLGEFRTFLLSVLCECAKTDKMNKTAQQIHQESIDFIANNINAKTSEIPKHFLEYWYTPEDPAEYLNKSSDLHSFFIFHYAFDAYNKTLGRESEISALKALATFGMFQIIIGKEIGEFPDLAIQPVNLFDFDNYSTLNITVL